MDGSVSRSATLFVVCTAHFLMPFMMSAVGVALPTIGRELDASALQLGLIETVYVLSASIFLLAMGRLGDIHGRRRIFLSGLVIFTTIGGLLSLVDSIEMLISLRFLQGMGGSMVMATTMAIVVSVFPAEERGKALGIAIASVYAGISCGPFIGGHLVTTLGWRWLFYLSIPLGLIAIAATLFKLRGEWADAKGEPFDWQGSLVYACGILLLITGASQLKQGWWAFLLVIAGIVVLGQFVRIEAKSRYPVLDIALLRDNRVFALSNLAAMFNYAATFGVTFFLSLYLQYVKGMSASNAGSILIIQPIIQTLLSPLCGRLADRYPAARVASGGMLLCAIGLALASALNGNSPLTAVIAVLLLLGLGFALFSSPNVSAIMGSVSPKYLGVASGLNSTMRTMGMMAGMTIITVVFSVQMGEQAVTATTLPAFLISMRLCLLVFCGLCVIGIFCSLARLRPRLDPIEPS